MGEERANERLSFTGGGAFTDMLPDRFESLPKLIVYFLMSILEFSANLGEQPFNLFVRQGHDTINHPLDDRIRAWPKWAQEDACPVRSQSGTDAPGVNSCDFHYKRTGDRDRFMWAELP